MEQVIKITTEIDSFTTKDGVVCSPMKVEDYWILPLGWEEELDSRDIHYEAVEVELPEEEIDEYIKNNHEEPQIEEI